MLLIWSWLVKAVYFVTKLWSVVPLAMLYLKMLPFVPWVWTEILMSLLWVGEQTQSRPYWLWMQERLLQLTRVNERGTAIDTNSLSSITLKNNSKGIWPLTPRLPCKRIFKILQLQHLFPFHPSTFLLFMHKFALSYVWASVINVFFGMLILHNDK